MQTNTMKINKVDLSSVKTGDTFIRMLAGVLAMEVIVGDIDDTHIWVGSIDGKVLPTKEEGWQFRRDLGTEVDEDLGSDGKNFVISYLKNKE